MVGRFHKYLQVICAETLCAIHRYIYVYYTIKCTFLQHTWAHKLEYIDPVIFAQYVSGCNYIYALICVFLGGVSSKWVLNEYQMITDSFDYLASTIHPSSIWWYAHVLDVYSSLPYIGTNGIGLCMSIDRFTL